MEEFLLVAAFYIAVIANVIIMIATKRNPLVYFIMMAIIGPFLTFIFLMWRVRGIINDTEPNRKSW